MKNGFPGRRGNLPAKGEAFLPAAYLRASLRLVVLLVLLASPSRLGATAQQGFDVEPAARASDSKNLAEEAHRYEQMLKEHPESPEIWSNLGVVRAMAGDCTEALPALHRAQSLNANLFNPWFFAGFCYFSFHQDKLAMESLQRAIRLNPRDPNAWFLKAQVSSDVGDLASSLDAVAHAHSLGTDSPEAYYLAGKDTMELAASHYRQVMKAGPQPGFYSLLLDGQRNAAMGVLNSAVDEYRRALKIEPNDPVLHFALGTAYLEMGGYAEAEISLRRCLELAPGSRWARLRLVLALFEQSKQNEAMELFGSVDLNDLESDSEYSDFLSCAYLLKSFSLAKTALTRARARFPNSPAWSEWFERLKTQPPQDSQNESASLELKSLTGVGLSLRFYLTARQEKTNIFEKVFASPAAFHTFRSDFMNEKWMEAAGTVVPLLKSKEKTETPARAFAMGEMLQSLSYGVYKQLGTQFPDSYPAMKLAAENLRAEGQTEKALAIYEGILKSEGPSPDVLREIAEIYWTDHKWDQALSMLEPLAQMDPHDPTIFVNLGRIYLFQRKLENAAEAFRRAIRIEPGMAVAHFGLGQALRGQGNLQEALRELKAATRIDPTNPKSHYELSQVYSRLGEKDLAAAEMASFQRLGSAADAEAQQRNGTLVPLD
jgi:tetratricopeptide (TPR) repeat protein